MSTRYGMGLHIPCVAAHHLHAGQATKVALIF